MNKRKISVLGGGIAGISATFHAEKLGFRVNCFEAAPIVGGLVSNFEVKGFRFDNAVHLSFTSDEYVRSFFDNVPYLTHKPLAYCKDREFWLKHPVQNNLYSLPVDEKVEHLKGLMERPTFFPENYSDWLEHQYGLSIANTYPKKYTKKYWGLDASALSITWIGNRMRRARVDEILQGALELRNENDYYTNEMRYPVHGGYFEFIRKIAEQCNIKCNMKAVEVDVELKTISFSNGQVEKFESLISTLPLPVLCSIIKNCPSHVKTTSESLLWTTVDLVSVGFDRPDVPPYLWFYLYDDDTLAARAYSPSLKSKDNAPVGKSSLQFEIYNLSSKEKFDSNDLIDNIKRKLMEMNICNESEILFMHHKHLPFGNVVFDLGMEERRKVVLDYLDDCGITSCGRFGAWDYYWSDQSFMSGKAAVERK